MMRPRIVDGGGGDKGGTGGPGTERGSGPRHDRRTERDKAASSTASGHLHVVRVAPAKLNLTLAVTGRRDDGYHSLHSVMVPLTLGDALTVSVALAGASQDSLHVSGLPIPTSADNLILRALRATREAVQAGTSDAAVDTPPLAARLTKRIPVSAGLGGGSSDAAAAIDAALTVWGAKLSSADTLAVAASLGSDVPFFLARSAALVAGRGEFVEPLPEFHGEPPAVLLVTPPQALSTSDVFAAFVATRPSMVAARSSTAPAALDVSERLVAAMRSGMTASVLLSMAGHLAEANDLVPPARSIVPELGEFAAALGRLLDRPIGQSGSGPTLWALYGSLPEARKAARMVRLGTLDGRLPAIGSGEVFVAAVSMAVRPHNPEAVNHGLGVGRVPQTGRPRTVHNGSDDPVGRAAGSAGADLGQSIKPAPERTTPKGDDPR